MQLTVQVKKANYNKKEVEVNFFDAEVRLVEATIQYFDQLQLLLFITLSFLFSVISLCPIMMC